MAEQMLVGGSMSELEVGASKSELSNQENILDTVLGISPIAKMHEAMAGVNGNVLDAMSVAEDSAKASVGNIANGMAQLDSGIMSGVDSNVADTQFVDGVEESLNKIFAAVIAGGLNSRVADDSRLLLKKADVFKQAISKFLDRFSSNVFSDEYAVLYSALSNLNIKVFSLQQLYTIMEQSADDILGSEKINLDKYSYTTSGGASTDEEKLTAFKLDVGEKFMMLSRLYVTIDEFETACQVYMMHFREQYMLQIAQSMAMIMTDGLREKVGRGRSRLWKGTDDCKEYYNLKVSILESIEDKSRGKGDVIIGEEWLSEALSDERAGESEILLDTGIEEIDSTYGGFSRGNMFETMGPPKGGKTTMTLFVAERALERGLNVAVWALEGSTAEWIAGFISLMVRKRDGMRISKRRIMKRIYHNDSERQAVIAAKNDLALSLSRGRLSFIEKVCYCETMRKELDNHWKNVNAFDVIVMDSPILAASLKGKSRTDAAAEAYVSLKHYVSYEMTRGAIALVTCQMKQEVINEIRNNPEAEIDVTAGGVTAETIRTPDFVICLVSTKQERIMGQVKIHDVASRHTESFNTFACGAQLDCNYFYSDPKLNELAQ